MRVFYFILFLSAWAVTVCAAQDSSFVPKGINTSINSHVAPLGTAEKCINFMFDDGLMNKRNGFEFLVENADREFTGLWTYVDDKDDKRLIGCAQNTANNYQSLYVSPIYSYAVAATSLQDYIYLNETGTGAVYNSVFIFANGKNRPYRYNGTDFRPLVEVPPGSFDFAPEKPSDNTDSVLNGWYYYGWQAAIPDSILNDTGGIFYAHADSMNLDGPSWRIQTDSNWVRIFNRPYTGPTTDESTVDSTVMRIGRTRAGKLLSDSMFLIALVRWENVYAAWSWIDSIPDESLGVDPNHPFIGFIDTVTHTAETASTDRYYKIGQPQWNGTIALDSSSGISADDTLLGDVIFRRYQFHLYDSSTGMLTEAGPYLRVPQDTSNSGKPQDSIINIITPAMDTSLPYWGILSRAEETYDSITSDTITYYGSVDPIVGPNGELTCPEGFIGFWFNGELVCRGQVERVRNTRLYTIVNPFYPVCTIKTVTGLCDTIRDSTPNGILTLRNVIPIAQQTIGQVDNVCVLEDRILMSQGNTVYFNGFTDRGSEIAYWPVGNSFSMGNEYGDEVNALHAGDNYIDILLNHSWYRARNTGANVFEPFEVINNIGCISTHSAIDLPGGGFAFESQDGIYYFGSHWQSPYKESGGNINRISDPIWKHLKNWALTDRAHCYAWLTTDNRHLVFSYPSLDTSLVYSLTMGQWAQWTVAPRMVTEYDLSPYLYYGLIPDSGLVFIKHDEDSLFRFGNVDTDNGDSVLAEWESIEEFYTGRMGKIEEFRILKYSDNDNGVDFNVYDVNDTGVVATGRDSTVYRVKRKDISCPESEAFKIEIKCYADSLAIDRIDIRYKDTGPMAVD